ncbi:MAG: hypothetical protein V1837_03000 [Candidatus Woesearchaeota archaeon]
MASVEKGVTMGPKSTVASWKGLDTEGDAVGIVLDEPVICGMCMAEMLEIKSHFFECPHCGNTYTKLEE